jgi:hypothetical protein
MSRERITSGVGEMPRGLIPGGSGRERNSFDPAVWLMTAGATLLTGVGLLEVLKRRRRQSGGSFIGYPITSASRKERA